MNLSSLVTSRELSERMVKLGAPTSTQFYWLGFKFGNEWRWLVQHVTTIYDSRVKVEVEKGTAKMIPAYLTGELGGMLREEWPESRLAKEWPITMVWELNETEAEARGLMWCYLKEQGLIK